MAGENVKRTYGIRGTATTGRIVQLLDTGEICDLPMKRTGITYNTQRRIDAAQSGNLYYYPKSVKIGPDKFVFFFTLISGGYNTYAQVVTIDANDNFTPGPRVLIHSAADATASLQDVADLGGGKIAVATKVLFIIQVNGDNSITIGTGVSVDVNATYCSIMAVDGSTIFASFRKENASGHGACKLFSVSGLTITAGTLVTHQSGGSCFGSHAVLIAPNKILFGYGYAGSASFRAKVGTITGLSIAFGAEFVKSGSIYPPKMVLASTDRVLVVANNGSNAAYAFMLHIADTTVTSPNPTQTFSSTYVFNNHDTALLRTNGKVFVAWQNGNNGATMFATTITLNGDSFTIDVPNGTNIGAIEGYQWVDVLLMDDDTVDSQRILAIPAGGNTVMARYSYRSGKFIGYHEGGGSVILKGLVKDLSGLEIGRPYSGDYLTGEMGLAGYRVGVAITDTQLLITDYLID